MQTASKVSTACKHTAWDVVDVKLYSGEIPRAAPNRAAHGNVRWTEECDACGAQRLVNVNGVHREEGPWGPDRDTRACREEEALQRTRERTRRDEIGAARGAGVVVVETRGEQALVRVGGAPEQWIHRASIDEAAAEETSLGAVYRGLRSMAWGS